MAKRTNRKPTAARNTAVNPVSATPAVAENNACPAGSEPVSSSVESNPETSATNTRSSKMTISLTKRNVEKSGNVAFAQAGVRASVYFNKNMFADGATIPESIEISVPGDVNPFAQPGAAPSGPKPKRTPEELQKALAAAREARKNETPAEKAARLTAKAAKLNKQAEKIAKAANAATTAAAPAASTTEPTPEPAVV